MPTTETRREFLTRATLTLVLVPVAAASAACASASGGAGGCDGIDPTSTVVQGHSHSVCIPHDDIANPPAGGATYTTSGPDPTHTVTLTQAQLKSIQAGQTVNVTTSVANGHTHDFALQAT
jgi:hypothetical protein